MLASRRARRASGAAIRGVSEVGVDGTTGGGAALEGAGVGTASEVGVGETTGGGGTTPPDGAGGTGSFDCANRAAGARSRRGRRLAKTDDRIPASIPGTRRAARRDLPAHS